MSAPFFRPLENDKPYVKMAAEGFAGSGKTFTLGRVAIWLHKQLKSTKPVALFDTEKAARFLIPMFSAAGVPAEVKSSRSMADLKVAMAACRSGFSDILLVDSLSSVYEDFVESYKERTRRQDMRFEDWGIVKPAWKREFAIPMVDDPYSLLFTGRAAYEYENEINDRGKREIYKSGIKMRGDAETAYEPDLLVYMHREEDILGDVKKVVRHATILKDRTAILDGKTFTDPTAEDFAPALRFCLENPGTSKDEPPVSAGKLFRTEEDRVAAKKKKEVVLGEVEGLLTATWPGQSADAKAAKVNALVEAFGVHGWPAVQSMTTGEIEAGWARLRELVTRGAA